MSDHTDTTLTDTERARINYCPNCGHSWSLHAPHGCAVCECRTGTSRIFSAVESIVAARVAQARADVIGLLRSEAAAHEALSQTWHDDMDIAALGFTTAADYLDGLTQGADHG